MQGPELLSKYIGASEQAVRDTFNRYVVYEPSHEKTLLWGFDTVLHKPDCSVTEDGLKLDSLDLERRGIVLSMEQKQRH